jgi:hypothetical protein
MNRFFDYKSTVATFGVVVPFAALVWLFAVPRTMSAVTFAALTLLALGAAFVALNTWRDGQPTRNIDHVLNDAETSSGESNPGSRTITRT